jgi:hypothetical protein
MTAHLSGFIQAFQKKVAGLNWVYWSKSPFMVKVQYIKKKC